MVRYSALDREKGGMVVEYTVELKNSVFSREEEVQDEEVDATEEGSKYGSFSVLSREDGDVACWGVHPLHGRCVWLEDILAGIGGVRALS
jgi:hypothetical protein